MLLSETDGLVPSEPVFVPRRRNFSVSNAKYAEDDGVVMSVVVDINGLLCFGFIKRRFFILVLL